jgi:hypothetical protein
MNLPSDFLETIGGSLSLGNQPILDEVMHHESISQIY